MVKGIENRKTICWELFSLTYGVFVNKLINDIPDIQLLNKKLEEMGYNIGIRLIEDLQVKTNIGRCNDFAETSNIISNVAFKQYMGITPKISNWNNTKTEFSIFLENNPLSDNVELDEKHKGLWYSNVICGIIRGCLEMTNVYFVQDVLHGDSVTELKVQFLNKIKEAIPVGEDLL